MMGPPYESGVGVAVGNTLGCSNSMVTHGRVYRTLSKYGVYHHGFWFVSVRSGCFEMKNVRWFVQKPLSTRSKRTPFCYVGVSLCVCGSLWFRYMSAMTRTGIEKQIWPYAVRVQRETTTANTSNIYIYIYMTHQRLLYGQQHVHHHHQQQDNNIIIINHDTVL